MRWRWLVLAVCSSLTATGQQRDLAAIVRSEAVLQNGDRDARNASLRYGSVAVNAFVIELIRYTVFSVAGTRFAESWGIYAHGSGRLCSNVVDLSAFLRALESGKLISAPSLQRMHLPSQLAMHAALIMASQHAWATSPVSLSSPTRETGKDGLRPWWSGRDTVDRNRTVQRRDETR